MIAAGYVRGSLNQAVESIVRGAHFAQMPGEPDSDEYNPAEFAQRYLYLPAFAR
jgi:hypothetical protein